MYEEEQGAPQNYIPVLLRYKWYVLAAATVLFILTSAVVLSLPSVYRSAGKVLVETQQIPDDLVRSTVTTAASERIEIIRQRVMTRTRLLEVVSKYSFFDLESKTPLEVTRQLEEIQSNIRIEVIEDSSGNRRAAKNAIAFSVAFDSKSRFIAQAVANDLMTLFLSENVKVRTERASETTSFLQEEARKIKAELDRTEAAVAELKQEHRDALPEHLSLYVDMREDSRRRLTQINRDIRAANERMEFIRSQLEIMQGQNGQSILGRTERIAALEEQLNELLLIYQPAHPDVIEVKQQLAALKRAPAPSQSVNAGPRNLSASELSLNQQLADLMSSTASLIREKEATEEKIKDTERRILLIPQVERELSSLQRENESKVKQYNLLISRSLEASVAESLEQESKAERFSILEPPVEPVEPVKPDRKKLMAMAVAASGGLPLGLVLLLGFLNKNIIGEQALMRVSSIPILATVPHTHTRQEIRAERRRRLGVLILAIALVVMCVVLLHVLYMPLGDIADKVLFRLGL